MTITEIAEELTWCLPEDEPQVTLKQAKEIIKNCTITDAHHGVLELTMPDDAVWFVSADCREFIEKHMKNKPEKGVFD